jgi:hypothetical protein
MQQRSHRIEGLTAGEFFERRLPGFKMHDAHYATRLSYSAIHDCAKNKTSPRPQTAQRLQEWSLSAVSKHRVYISATKTLGLSEPGDEELAAAGGR